MCLCRRGAHGLISLRIAKEHDPWVEFGDVRESAAKAREVMLRGILA